METFIFANIKGGVYKTALAFFTAKTLAERGNKVLCLDVDQQAHLAKFLTTKNGIKHSSTLADVFISGSKLSEAICTVDKNLDCVYADKTNHYIDGWLFGQGFDRDYILLDKVKDVKENYDYIIIDFPPNLNNLTLNALLLKDAKVIVPVHLSYSSLDGLAKIEDNIKMISSRANNNLVMHKVVVGIKHSAVSKHNEMVRETLHKYYSDVLCPYDMPLSIDYENATTKGMNIGEYLDEVGKGNRKGKLVTAIDNIVNDLIG